MLGINHVLYLAKLFHGVIKLKEIPKSVTQAHRTNIFVIMKQNEKRKVKKLVITWLKPHVPNDH